MRKGWERTKAYHTSKRNFWGSQGHETLSNSQVTSSLLNYKCSVTPAIRCSCKASHQRIKKSSKKMLNRQICSKQRILRSRTREQFCSQRTNIVTLREDCCSLSLRRPILLQSASIVVSDHRRVWNRARTKSCLCISKSLRERLRCRGRASLSRWDSYTLSDNRKLQQIGQTCPLLASWWCLKISTRKLWVDSSRSWSRRLSWREQIK